jgi:Fic family protein
MGRLLISLEFVERDLLPAPLLYLSAFFERNRDDYMDRLRAVSTDGRWVEWIDFFLEGIEEQSEDAVRRAREMLELRDQYRNELQTARSSALQLTLVDMLFERPVVTIPQAAERLEVTYRSAQLNVQKLVGAGVLRVVENMRPQLFVADAIVDVATRVLR